MMKNSFWHFSERMRIRLVVGGDEENAGQIAKKVDWPAKSKDYWKTNEMMTKGQSWLLVERSFFIGIGLRKKINQQKID